MNAYDAETPSVFSCERRTAKRKEHRCCECHATIKIGDRYELVKGIWDGKAGRFKTCIECADLRDEMSRKAYERESPPFGYLIEFAKEDGELPREWKGWEE